MDLNALQQKINSYTTVVSSWVKNVGKIYFDSKPAVVKVKMLDDHGKVVDVSIPNIAKVKADFDAKKKFTHSMGIGVDPSGNLNNGKGLALGDNDTGFRQNGDGNLEVFANNRMVARFKSDGIHSDREFYYTNWIRNVRETASGLYWHNSKNPGYRWHIYPQNQADMTLRTGKGNGGIKGTIENETARGYVHWTTGNQIGFLNNLRQWALKISSNKSATFYGDILMSKSNPFINFNDSTDAGVDVAIGVSGDNFYIREPEDKGKEWFRIEDDKDAYIFGNKVNHRGNVKFYSGSVKADKSGGTGFISPPSGYSIGNLRAVVVSPRIIYFNGDVDKNDTLICRVTSNNDNGKIKVECRNSEQRGAAYFNFLTIWSK
jgi:hypothetical protein